MAVLNNSIADVFMKYTKPVIIQWLCNQYPVFFKNKEDIIKELNDCKNDIDFEKNHAEIEILLKKRTALKPEKFKSFDDYLLKKIFLDKKITSLLKKQDKILNL